MNIENVLFDDGMRKVAVNFQRGSAENDTMTATQTSSAAVMLHAGDGDDRIYWQDEDTNGKPCIDVGNGNDTLVIVGKREDYTAVKFNNENVWHLLHLDTSFLMARWIELANVSNIENIEFSDTKSMPISSFGTSTGQNREKTFTRGAKDNHFDAPAGRCTFKLKAGRNDSITFSSSNYESGVTRVNVQGMRFDDSVAFIDLFGCHVVKDTTVSNSVGKIVGTQIVLWNNNAQLVVDYTA